jgi:Zn-dependent protease
VFQLTPEGIAMGLTYYVVLLFSLSFHEAAHAWMALRLGDDTALREGRITLNPLAHIDPIGTVLIPLLQIFWGGLLIGWAKPTPYNPGNFRRETSVASGHMLVAAAGPLSNGLLALGFTGLLFAALRAGVAESLGQPGLMLLGTGIAMNVVLALFNLIPLPPLDGSKVASWGLPRALGQRYDAVMEPYGMWILLILFATGALGLLLSPFVRSLTGFLYRSAGLHA